MIIRPERPDDVEAIDELTRTAFEPMSFSDGLEAPILHALRAAGDLTLSLVAVEDDLIVGHVAFSPVTIDGTHNSWFGLGPISVRADRQRQGAALTAEGIRLHREQGARGCALIGNPLVYSGMGFTGGTGVTYRDLDPRIIQTMVFRGLEPQGELRFATAFETEES
ncbi:GNAT family N-acetyltransferase [Leifsonia flava]|uniref:N-acetyltransferase n=1 Tax=Orlajensenia leifsoniae TaxID=2561933 RepID=A0A4Y9QQE7_9MICO|nr:N-acetyltransferase [Leifsonia flava]TFV94854.1 N-acetyltransferase [Leifsonia flava]